MEQQDSFELPNPARHTGSAEFALLRVYGQSSAKARWMNGDPSLQGFADDIAAHVPVGPADMGAVDLLRWGTLSCDRPDAQCKFRLSSARDAVYAQLRSTVKVAPAASPPTKAPINPGTGSPAPISASGNSAKQVQIGQSVSQDFLIYQVPPTYPQSPAKHESRER
jgi:hypothetical protein